MNKCLRNIKIQMELKKNHCSLLSAPRVQKAFLVPREVQRGSKSAHKGAPPLLHLHGMLLPSADQRETEGERKKLMHTVYIGGREAQLMSFKCPLH